MRWALAGSAAAHATVAALCLLEPVRRPADEVPPVEVELVQQPPMQAGGSSAQPSQAQASPSGPQDAGEVSQAPPSPPAPAAQKSAPAVNLGNGPQDLDPLSVRGEGIVPPAPDATFRNRPPAYPAAAVRARAEGIVQLLVRVSAAGVPEQVAISATSGHASLDRAAREAVLLWRFQPARSGGVAVPFEYVMNIRFSLDER